MRKQAIVVSGDALTEIVSGSEGAGSLKD